MSDEEKLREEAARRLERRRRKLENASERLALITGQPASSINLNDSYCVETSEAENPLLEMSSRTTVDPSPSNLHDLSTSSIKTTPNGSLPSSHIDASDRLETVPDPPLENLTRGNLQSSPGKEAVTPPPPVSNFLWIFLALVTFILLQFGHGHYIGNSVFTLFLITLVSLVLLGRVEVTSTAGSIISTVLVLCGLKPNVVKWIIKSVETLFTMYTYFVVYFTTFLIAHQVYNHIIVKFIV